jgi:uncharacterized protein
MAPPCDYRRNHPRPRTCVADGLALIRHILFVCLALGSTQVTAASFNCEATTSAVERLICGDRELSGLDDQMAVWYRAVRRALLPESEYGNQRRWLSERNRCQTGQCLKDLYESRIAELQKLADQPSEDGSRNRDSDNKYVVRCAPDKQVLSIQEGALDSARTTANAITEHPVRPSELVQIKETARQTLVLPKGKRQFECRVGKSELRVVVGAHVFNANIQGECGAAEPIIEATVVRNGKKLLDGFPFGSCRGGTARAVHRIEVDERSRTIRFLVTLDGNWVPLRLEKSFPLGTLPADLNEAIFETVPTGDVDVDLFIAVRKRHLEGVQEALARGAWPNARDLNGFTPVSYVWRSGWGSPRSIVNPAEEERVLEQIAEMLFSKGATANIRNREGTSLLEYLLLGMAPARVIDLALQNGADPRTDRSLRAAAQWGDAALVKKLLALGADPNAKGPDRSTALRTAAISGFYTYGPNYPKRPIEAFAACLRLLFEGGAKMEEAQPNGNLFATVVSQFHKDRRARVILAELVPHTRNEDLKAAYSMLSRIAASEESAQLREWLGQYVRP